MSHSTDTHAQPNGMRLHPTLVMVLALLAAAILTHLLPVEGFNHAGKLVVMAFLMAVLLLVAIAVLVLASVRL